MGGWVSTRPRDGAEASKPHSSLFVVLVVRALWLVIRARWLAHDHAQGLMAMSHSQHRNSNHPTVKSGWQMPRSRDQSETSNIVTIASDGEPRDAAEADGAPCDAAEATWLRTRAPRCCRGKRWCEDH